MANKRAAAQLVKKPAASTARTIKLLAVLLVLLMLASVGFALGIYLGFIDFAKIAANMKLYDYPVIGQYFPRPQLNFEPVDVDAAAQPQTPPTPAQPAQVQAVQAAPPVPGGMPQQINLADPNADIKEKEAKMQQQEEAKRIAKLARLYGGMKPAEAVKILNQLDDDTVVAILKKMEEEQVSKILALFDASRAARLSEKMLRN